MEPISTKFQGRTALVTGSARRVGRVIARHLAAVGADIIVHYNKSEPEANSLAMEISELGRSVTLWQFDLSDSAKLELEADSIFETLPSFDILVNNASPYFTTDFSDLSLAEWQNYLGVHLLSPFLLTHNFAQRLISKRGDVVNILDTRAGRPRSGYLPYGVTKIALEQLTKNLAFELAPVIRVNGIASGYILSAENSSNAEVSIKEDVLLKRMGEPKDIAQAVEFLLDSQYITGEILHVDGGRRPC